MDRVYQAYRWMHWLHLRRIPFLPGLIKTYIRVFYACDLPASVELGPGTRFPHNGLGVVLHDRVKAGHHCTIFQNVTIGGNGRKVGNGVPRLGNNVTIYSGAVVVGNITIGDNAIIGANAVVLESVPANALAAGVPAKIRLRPAETDEAQR